jgi:hypothetical protein
VALSGISSAIGGLIASVTRATFHQGVTCRFGSNIHWRNGQPDPKFIAGAAGVYCVAAGAAAYTHPILAGALTSLGMHQSVASAASSIAMTACIEGIDGAAGAFFRALAQGSRFEERRTSSSFSASATRTEAITRIGSATVGQVLNGIALTAGANSGSPAHIATSAIAGVLQEYRGYLGVKVRNGNSQLLPGWFDKRATLDPNSMMEFSESECGSEAPIIPEGTTSARELEQGMMFRVLETINEEESHVPSDNDSNTFYSASMRTSRTGSLADPSSFNIGRLSRASRVEEPLAEVSFSPQLRRRGLTSISNQGAQSGGSSVYNTAAQSRADIPASTSREAPTRFGEQLESGMRNAFHPSAMEPRHRAYTIPGDADFFQRLNLKKPKYD